MEHQTRYLGILTLTRSALLEDHIAWKIERSRNPALHESTFRDMSEH